MTTQNKNVLLIINWLKDNQIYNFLIILLKWLFIVSITWFPLFLLSHITGTYYPDPNKCYISFKEDIYFHIAWILIIPLGIFLFLKSFSEFKILRLGFVEKTRYEEYNISYNKILTIDCLISVVGTTIFTIAVKKFTFKSWWMHEIGFSEYFNWIQYIYFIGLCALIIAISMSIFSYVIEIAKWLRKNFEKNPEIIRVEIYHEDGCGGLKWMFSPFINLLYISIPLYAIGFGHVFNHVVNRSYSWNNPLVLWNLLWPTLYGPILLLIVIHFTGFRKYLLEQRDKKLKSISHAIRMILQKTIDESNQNYSKVPINKKTDREKNATEIINLYKHIRKDFPVWPFPKYVIGIVFSSGPLILTLFSSILFIMKELLSYVRG